MELTIKDRVILLNTAIPSHGTRDDLKNLIIPITNKLKLSSEEQKEIGVEQGAQQGMTTVSYTANALISKSFDFTEKELEYLRKRVEMIDQNGMYSIETIETYEKILNE